MQRRQFLISALAGSLASRMAISVASAAERKTFDAAGFEAAQQRGARILVDISATWCPTCKAQKPIIDSLAEQSVNNDLVIFSVDFDSQKPIVRQLRAQSQSTLIAFRGKTETARSVGDTDPGSIAALVRSTLTK
jgi:thiol-disulfide isomerase/thioredoxin